jgi:hypothetical protein
MKQHLFPKSFVPILKQTAKLFEVDIPIYPALLRTNCWEGALRNAMKQKGVGAIAI